MLKDLNLKAEALNSLKLPVIVRAGFIGSITLKVLFLGFILCLFVKIIALCHILLFWMSQMYASGSSLHLFNASSAKSELTGLENMSCEEMEV